MPQISAAPQNFQTLTPALPAPAQASPSSQSTSIWCTDCFHIDTKPAKKLIPPQILFGPRETILPPLPESAPQKPRTPFHREIPGGIEIKFSENGQHLDLNWDPNVEGASLQAALDKALPGAVISNEHREHPFTYMTITTPQNESWELTWLTGGIVATYGVSLEKVATPKREQSQPLQSLKNSAMHDYFQPIERAIRNPQELAHLENTWGQQNSIARETAQIDFQREMLLVVASGQKGSSGYDVNIESAEIVDNKMIVRYSEQDAGAGVHLTVLTNPTHIVKTPRFDGPIEFVKVD